MQIHGLNKTTLLDYPEHVAATIFTGGCNFLCPFCHNKDLVIFPNNQPKLSEYEVLSFLEKRRNILTGVCISGGEPTIQPDIAEFLYHVKSMNLLVKLDTNGYHPEVIQELYEEKLIDDIAMDIKGGLSNYKNITGLSYINTDFILESIRYIMTCGIRYEFRTTVVRELHTARDFEEIGRLIENANAYFIQSYKDADTVIEHGYHCYPMEELEKFLQIIQKYVPNAKLRGVD